MLGPRRMEWFHPYRKWLDAGLTIGGGSDHMIRMDPIAATNPWDPWLGIWVAVTRKVEGGGPLNPDQRLTRVEALRFYTINNARLHSEEREKGSIEPGKLADLILVDRDPLTCPEDDLRSTKVLWTMVGGKVVYSGRGRQDRLKISRACIGYGAAHLDLRRCRVAPVLDLHRVGAGPGVRDEDRDGLMSRSVVEMEAPTRPERRGLTHREPLPRRGHDRRSSQQGDLGATRERGEANLALRDVLQGQGEADPAGDRTRREVVASGVTAEPPDNGVVGGSVKVGCSRLRRARRRRRKGSREEERSGTRPMALATR